MYGRAMITSEVQHTRTVEYRTVLSSDVVGGSYRSTIGRLRYLYLSVPGQLHGRGEQGNLHPTLITFFYYRYYCTTLPYPQSYPLPPNRNYTVDIRQLSTTLQTRPDRIHNLTYLPWPGAGLTYHPHPIIIFLFFFLFLNIKIV